MKTSKRKRSTKTAPAAEVPVVDAVAAETPAEATAENPPVAELTNELSPAAVEALVVEPVAAEPVAAEPEIEVVDPNAETVVAEAAELVLAEPAQAVEPVVVLAANCSVKDAAALKISLCAIANESTEVTLDVSAVERVDTATMQLLCAFVRDRSGRNQSVAWRGESQALQDAVRLLGVGELLGFESKGVAA
jgi:ABC-type transporter Mla MlaB component